MSSAFRYPESHVFYRRLRDEMKMIVRGDGIYLYDSDGKEYIDLTSGIGVNNLGHGHPAILEAVHGQADKFLHTCFQVGMYESYLTLADRLHQLTPGEFKKKTFFVTSGAEAVEGAVKFARAYTGRDAVISLHLAFHGRTFYALQLTSRAKPYRDGFGPLAAPIHRIPFPYVYRFRGEDPQACVQASLDALDALFQCELPPEAFAALIFEPIQGEAGIVVPPDDFFQRLAEICRTHGILLIADEVQTGYGRTGKMFACEHEGVTPDIMCLAKGITGGYLPLAATLTTKKIFDGFCFDYKDQKTFFHGHTYTGNPLCCAAALANLEVFKKGKVLDKLQPKIKFLSQRLEMFYNLSHVGDVRQKGFMVGIELVKNRQTKEPYPWAEKVGARVCQEVRKKGLILRPLGNVIVIMPPLAMTVKELDKLLDITYWAIEKVTGSLIEEGLQYRLPSDPITD
ncbi:MAG: aspartate aminotransferase family protein [Bacteroidetes bacterium]|nr:aspartate aminotransferase family protein [Bacteroidota bacterium]